MDEAKPITLPNSMNFKCLGVQTTAHVTNNGREVQLKITWNQTSLQGRVVDDFNTSRRSKDRFLSVCLPFFSFCLIEASFCSIFSAISPIKVKDNCDREKIAIFNPPGDFCLIRSYTNNILTKSP